MAAGLKQKTRKVLDMSVDGYTLMCVVHYEQKQKPYHVYAKWYDVDTMGQRMEQIARCKDMYNVVEFIRRWMAYNRIGYNTAL